jgi:uncharacterized membrane protein
LNIGWLHPVVVHFAIVLVLIGVLFRLLSLASSSTRLSFVSPAATTLILAGAVAVFFASQSGHDAHGPVERVPDSREVVELHEAAAKWSTNFTYALALIEVGLLFLRNSRYRRHALIAASVVGLFAGSTMMLTAWRGGNLVYAHAGGVGIRSGESADVGNLLLAGLYHQALADRDAGRRQEAAALADLALRRFPSSIAVRMFHAESILLDRQDPSATLAALGTITVPPGETGPQVAYGLLKVDALQAAGRPGEAQAELQRLAQAFPTSGRIKGRLGKGR